MAKSKKKKSGSSRRRRVSGISGGSFTPIIGAVLGGFGSNMISKALGSKLDPKIVAGLQLVAAAVFVPKLIKGPMGAGVAAGVGAVSGMKLLQEMKVISGVSDFYNLRTVNGMERKVAGSAKQMLAGVELARSKADERKYNPGNHNFATASNQLNVLSGMESEYDEWQS